MDHKTLTSRPKEARSPILLLGLRVGKKRRERWWDWITGSEPVPDVRQGSVVEKASGAFCDGREADARVVTTDQSPYLDVVLFDPDGSEVGVADPVTCPKNTFTIEVDGRRYRVGLLPVEADGQPPTNENPYRETARYRCDSCGHDSWRGFLAAAGDLEQRIDPGGTYTDRECPECGALMYPNPRPERN